MGAELAKRQQQQQQHTAPTRTELAAKKQQQQHGSNEMIETRINTVLEHVLSLAEKMGDTDIDALLDAKKVEEWEQVLTDAETGKLTYPDAVAKAEEIITTAPAALKLAEVTGALELIEEDGGAKGVNEITNFRNILKQIKWLPQYAAVLEEFSAWKNGERTIQEILVWTEDKMAKGEIDGTWLAKAYETTAKAASATTTKPATATTAAAAATNTVTTAAATAATTTVAAGITTTAK